MSLTGEAFGGEGLARRRARLWRAAWAGGCAVLFIIDAGAAHGQWPLAAMALTAAGLPALAGLALENMPPWLQIGQWAAGGCIAAALAGGVAGPFGAFCLAPLAASAMLGSGSRLALGGVWSLAAALALALLQLGSSSLAPLQPEMLNALLCLLLTVLMLASALALDHARRAGEARERAARAAMLSAVAAGQNGYLLRLETGVGVTEVYGAGLAEITPVWLYKRGVASLAESAARQAVFALLERGAGALRFPLAAQPERMLELELTPIEGGAAGSLRDVTAQREREEAADEARKRAEGEAAGRARFLASMSHELRTPLNAIIGFSDVMRMRLFGPLSDRYSEYAQLIHESGQHLLDLIGDVLDISKIDADRYELNRERMDMREPVQAALRLVRPQADMAQITLRADLGEALEIEADRRAIKQIVLNLIANALKFTPKGGMIGVALRQAGEVAELKVGDSGVGIAPEDLARLGRPFEQAGDMASRRQGTGLGLSLVRAFAGLHGGEMRIDSVLGEGTTVTVRLPLPADVVATPPAIAAGDNILPFPPAR